MNEAASSQATQDPANPNYGMAWRPDDLPTSPWACSLIRYRLSVMKDLARAFVMKGMVVSPTLTVMRGIATPLTMEDAVGVFHLNRHEWVSPQP